jgi:hypothetical protein
MDAIGEKPPSLPIFPNPQKLGAQEWPNGGNSESFSSRLLYLSQTLSPQARYQEQARHIARRVFECWPAELRRENEDKWDFPPKPKWMRWKTYNQLDARVMDYESAADGLAVYRVLRLAGKLGGTH